MLDFISQLLGYVEVVWGYFINLIATMVTFIDTMSMAVGLPLYLAAFVPSILSTAISAVVAIATVKLLLGR